MIDVTNTENRLTLQEVSALLGKHIKTVQRWCRRLNSDGTPRRFLETVRAGRTIYTTREAVNQYVQQYTADVAGNSAFTTSSIASVRTAAKPSGTSRRAEDDMKALADVLRARGINLNDYITRK